MKLTRKISLVVAVPVLAVSLIISTAVFGASSSLGEKMALIKIGDSKASVLRMLGEPQSRQFTPSGEMWIYIDNSTTQSGRFTDSMVNTGLSVFGATIPRGLIPSFVAKDEIGSRDPNQIDKATVTFDQNGRVTSNAIPFTSPPQQTSRDGGRSSPATTKNVVYVGPTSPVFHSVANCSELTSPANKLITFSSAEEAIESGGTPCKYCNPS